MLQAVAASFLILGAVVLAWTFFPIINPRLWEQMTKDPYTSFALRYSFGLLLSFALLSGAHHLNLAARKLRNQEQKQSEESR